MPGEPGRAPPLPAVEVWPSVAPFGEAGRISVSIIVLAILCSSAGSVVDAALGRHQMRSSATPPVASVTPNLLLLEIRRAFAATHSRRVAHRPWAAGPVRSLAARTPA